MNLFIKPITVERAGAEAMLDFGLALVLEAPAFTFPRAHSLKASGWSESFVEEGIAPSGASPNASDQREASRINDE